MFFTEPHCVGTLLCPTLAKPPLLLCFLCSKQKDVPIALILAVFGSIGCGVSKVKVWPIL